MRTVLAKKEVARRTKLDGSRTTGRDSKKVGAPKSSTGLEKKLRIRRSKSRKWEGSRVPNGKMKWGPVSEEETGALIGL